MEVFPFELPGVLLLTPRRIGDHRGYFAETFRLDRFKQSCGRVDFVQGCCSLEDLPAYFQWNN
ncbi:dTDP-4-dehydrorhamnose 3,5-epimerase family protein [Novosphingobium sp. 1949]|uniref:dTDP-4-dehydrorhamnose 3,5-epimerase n=1 Tax=Novosphingobium organovorum TaxID=2930092 RepID=A0ABT0BA69_9SPHN|nr:dTDP-4-dehydrorhamnose 3,5-epimerase family protein [Novosphingobium organovorum]MCJ2181937.1 dTDP-4-dehydrorhamnose 3,5-epimerase family protein [Novosphingobium organovorum]